MKNIFKVKVPKFIFPGFYNTDFDPEYHLNEEDIEDGDYTEAARIFVDKVFNNIINHYKKVLPNQFKLLNYELISPKEYNYRNDEIVLEIEADYESILFYFFNYKEDYLPDYLELQDYNDDCYHEAMLELLLEFWPFVDGLYEDSLKELFIYG